MRFADEHISQLLGYLKSARIEHGLLINFGSYKFQIKKYALSKDGNKPKPLKNVFAWISGLSLSSLRSFAANLKCEGDLPVKRIVIANR